MKNTNLKSFKKGRTGNPKGRPLKLLKQINLELKDQGYEPIKLAHIKEAYELLLNLPENKITSISKNKDLPFFLRIIARRLLDKKSGHEMVEKILDRVWGKPKIAIDHTTSDQTQEEKEAFAKEIAEFFDKRIAENSKEWVRGLVTNESERYSSSYIENQKSE